jgi:hypothetical protein
MWSLVVAALAGAVTLPGPSADPVPPFRPDPSPSSCVVPAGALQPRDCHDRGRREPVSCVLPVVFRGSLVQCDPGRPPVGRVVPVPLGPLD